MTQPWSQREADERLRQSDAYQFFISLPVGTLYVLASMLDETHNVFFSPQKKLSDSELDELSKVRRAVAIARADVRREVEVQKERAESSNKELDRIISLWG